MDNDRSGCVVLVPTRDHIEPGCEYGLRRLEQLGYEVWRAFGASAIDQARNRLATAALSKGFTELMWIDSDVQFDPESVDILRSHQLPMVCGIYGQKRPGFAQTCSFLPGTEEIRFGKHGGLMEIRHAAGGFLFTRDEVYLKIFDQENLPICSEKTSPRIPFFMPMILGASDDHWYLGEDFAFSERARRCGFSIYADTTIRLEHIGRYNFSWDDLMHSRERHVGYTINIGDDREDGSPNPDERSGSPDPDPATWSVEPTEPRRNGGAGA
ncbi:hypothetical protein BJY24_007672 [Nocardia transvalensis]|uniref:Glycosyltransferase n=1 Tax=Nocardia transvalensis TaxID=37333 RepID=A0A7W9PMN1_9NOCA|nr:hypothetical protein [Nocardia transvalensis]MBB5918760.1 hypothetical protein [Nocardia transvalensis]